MKLFFIRCQTLPKTRGFAEVKIKTLYKSLVKHMFRNSSVLSVKKCFDSKLFSKMKFAVVFLVLAFVTFASATIIGDGARASANIIADGVEDGVLNINENAKRDFKDSLNNLKDIRNETDPYKKMLKVLEFSLRAATIQAKIASAINNPAQFVATNVLNGISDQLLQKLIP